jgi:PAS domain-containing protein
MTKPKLQSLFFSLMADPQSFRAMFEHLPDVFFFAKDSESRMIAASSAVVARLGLKSESEMIGRSDDDFFPKAIATGFRKDDLVVMQEEKPLINRMEVWYDQHRQLDWFVTTKLPV